MLGKTFITMLTMVSSAPGEEQKGCAAQITYIS